MIPHNRVCLTVEDEHAVAKVAASGQIGQGPNVFFFEDELAERFRPDGAAVCVSSGTAALMLAIDALRLEEVTLPTYACIALYHATIAAGDVRRVRFVDCAPTTLCSHKASIAVHTYGTPCAVLGSIEDFTHAPGGEYNGDLCGSMGTLSVISFGATKPLGCGGGGAVLGSEDLIEQIRDQRDYDGKRQFGRRFNWEMSEFSAAIGRNRLKRLDAENAWRRETADRYADATPFALYGSADSTFYRFVIKVPDTGRAKAWFAARGVETIAPLEPWELIHSQLGIADRFPAAEDAAAHALSLPVWPGMDAKDVDCVLATLRQIGDMR